MSNDNGPTVVPFKPRVIPTEVTKPEPNAYVVELLKFWLKKAQDGEIGIIALAAVNKDGVAHSAYEPQDTSAADITKMMGAVAYLSHRIGAAALDGDDYGEQPDEPTKA